MGDRPASRLAAAACAASVATALALLWTIGYGSAAFTVAAIVLWGAAFIAIPVTLQAAVLRVAPQSADTASALYVVAFQIGIGGGALAGSIVVSAGHLAELPILGAALAAAGTLVLLAARRAFPSRIKQAPGPGRRASASAQRSGAPAAAPGPHSNPLWVMAVADQLSVTISAMTAGSAVSASVFVPDA